MHNKLIPSILFFYLLSSICFSQDQLSKPIIIGEKIIIHSEIMEEDREIWIHVPHNDGDSIYAEKKYPVLYLLDGNAHFHSVSGMVDQLSNSKGNHNCPNMIVVGILNTDRTRDLTTSIPEEGFFTTVPSGGADKFLSFLEKELIPLIEKKYNGTPYRTSVGHSFGGLFALHALNTRPDLFDNYIAIDPSLWFDDNKVVLDAQKALSTSKMDQKYVYISAANTFGEDMTLKQALKDKSENTNHIRAIKSYVDQLDKMQLSALHYQWKFYPEDDHGSVPLISEYDAFRYIFKFLEFKAFDQLFNPIKGYSLEAKKSVIDHHFDQISERYGYHVLPDERFLNDLGYGFMQNEMPKEAEAFFQMNIEHHPSSSNVYDSMGDFYRENNEKEKAIEMYRAALDRLQHPASVGKLQELLEEKE